MAQVIAERTGSNASEIADALLKLALLGTRAQRRSWVRIGDGWSLWHDGSFSKWLPATGELV